MNLRDLNYINNSKMDNSFDRVSPQLIKGGSHNPQNKLQIVHRRKMSRTKRRGTQANKHEPLSKHIPKDILSTNYFGASKNLLLSNHRDLSGFSHNLQINNVSQIQDNSNNMHINASVIQPRLSDMSYPNSSPQHKFVTPDPRNHQR